jgi:dTDP-4-dehydrorhamnose reductase
MTLISPEQIQPRLPMLVTGITGVAGFNALHYLQRRYPGQIIGIRPHQTWQLNGAGIHAQDADDTDGLSDLFRHYRFRAVLNCVGNCALKSCELDRAMARQVNVHSAHAIVEQVRKYQARLVHLSSDLVFSGTRGGQHVETDPVDPVTFYGKSMVEGERWIQDACPAGVILRISLPMGPSFNRHAGAIDWIDSRFRKDRPATLYFDEVRSVTYCDDLNCVFERFLAGDESGVYHLGGLRALTLYQIGQIINRIGGYPPELLKGCPRILAGPVPPRAGNVSMSSAKLVGLLGHSPFQPWPAKEMLVPNDRRWHHNRTTGENGSFAEIVRRLYCYEEDSGCREIRRCKLSTIQ